MPSLGITIEVVGPTYVFLTIEIYSGVGARTTSSIHPLQGIVCHSCSPCSMIISSWRTLEFQWPMCIKSRCVLFFFLSKSEEFGVVVFLSSDHIGLFCCCCFFAVADTWSGSLICSILAIVCVCVQEGKFVSFILSLRRQNRLSLRAPVRAACSWQLRGAGQNEAVCANHVIRKSDAS